MNGYTTPPTQPRRDPSWFSCCAALAYLLMVLAPAALLVWAVLR